MSIEDKFSKIVTHRDGQKIAAADNYKVQSKRRLQKSIETKINTTMIGAISAIEAKFGHLWRQGTPAHQLTEQELEILALKDELRTEILNNGNNQKRAAVAEINQYEIEWSRHHMDLAVENPPAVSDDYRRLCEDTVHPKAQAYLDKINKKDGQGNG